MSFRNEAHHEATLLQMRYSRRLYYYRRHLADYVLAFNVVIRGQDSETARLKGFEEVIVGSQFR